MQQLEWSVNADGVTFNINGQVAQYPHDQAIVIGQAIARDAEEAPRTEQAEPEAKPGEIVSLTAEELAALKAAAGQ